VLFNGGFEDGSANWAFYTDGAGSYSSSSPGYTGSRAARIQLSAPGSNVQLYQLYFPLESNTQYTLRFTANCNSGHDVAVYLHQHASPWTNYGINNWVVDLQPSWSTYSLTFTTQGFSGTTTDARFRFWFSPYDAAGDVYSFDDILLYKSSGAGALARNGEELQEVQADVVPVPTTYGLMENYPNPFNPTTTIQYALPENAQVTLRVYTTLGQEVITLADGAQEAGYHSYRWDGRSQGGVSLASGIYLYRLTAVGPSGNAYVSTKRMMLLK
jgi:hypothetical protein